MKKAVKLPGLIALAAVVGLGLAGCKQPGGDDHEHEWGAWTVTTAPTCTTRGEETRTCGLDSKHKETRSVPINSNAHNWGSWTVTTPATITAEGVETRTCVHEPAHKETRTIPKLTDPNHTHQWGAWIVTKPATETENGVETRTCTLDPSHIETRTIPATGVPGHTHQWGSWIVTTAPTCATEGEETRECLLNALHKETQPVAINPNAHDWGNYIVTKTPTETEDGEETRTCAHNIGHTETRPIAALGHMHQWGNWVVTTAPTCTTEGEETRECVLNALHKETQSVATNPNAHDWEWVSTATFISAGIETQTCKHNSSHTNGTRPADQRIITTTADWTTALSQLNGKTDEYTLTISGDIGVAGSTADSFGATPSGSLSVTLKGNGRLYLTSQGSIVRIGANQTLSIDSADLTLEGLKSGQNGATQDNNTSVVYVNTGGTLDLKDGIISKNCLYRSNGSGVYVYGTFTMYGGEISDNTGIGVHVYGTFTMNGGKISGNTSTYLGGGVLVDEFYDNDGVLVEGVFTMYNGTISNNTAGCGGGVFNSGLFIMNDGEISGNSANDEGGGVANGNGFIMNGGKISGNSAKNGGGVYIDYIGERTVMNGGKISDNTASFDGGGVWVRVSSGIDRNAEISINDVEISDNTAFWGGGVCVEGLQGLAEWYSGTITINGAKISGNTAETGGGVYLIGHITTPTFFRIVNGTIYGSDEVDESLRNNSTGTDTSIGRDGGGAALYRDSLFSNVYAQYGNGSTWYSLPLTTINDHFSYTDNTIRVVNGVLQ